MKNLELAYFATPVELAEAAARDWLAIIPTFRTQHLVALSGGRIASHFFDAVTDHAVALGVSFKRVHFFWADERCVPPDHPDSNFRVANVELLGRLRIAHEKIHRIRGELKPADAAAEASAEVSLIAPMSGAGLPVFDLIFLGMGEDGHVASLFPKAPASVVESEQTYLSVRSSSKPPPQRISLSYAAIASAKNVWVLVSGPDKEKVFHESLSLNGKTPLARVIQSRRRTRIFTDLPPPSS